MNKISKRKTLRERIVEEAEEAEDEEEAEKGDPPIES